MGDLWYVVNADTVYKVVHDLAVEAGCDEDTATYIASGVAEELRARFNKGRP